MITFKLTVLFGLLKLSVCPRIFIDYDLGDQHPLILNLISRHEFHDLLAEDASRLVAGTLPFKYGMVEQGLLSTSLFFPQFD